MFTAAKYKHVAKMKPQADAKTLTSTERIIDAYDVLHNCSRRLTSAKHNININLCWDDARQYDSLFADIAAEVVGVRRTLSAICAAEGGGVDQHTPTAVAAYKAINSAHTARLVIAAFLAGDVDGFRSYNKPYFAVCRVPSAFSYLMTDMFALVKSAKAAASQEQVV